MKYYVLPNNEASLKYITLSICSFYVTLVKRSNSNILCIVHYLSGSINLQNKSQLGPD